MYDGQGLRILVWSSCQLETFLAIVDCSYCVGALLLNNTTVLNVGAYRFYVAKETEHHNLVQFSFSHAYRVEKHSGSR